MEPEAGLAISGRTVERGRRKTHDCMAWADAMPGGVGILPHLLVSETQAARPNANSARHIVRIKVIKAHPGSTDLRTTMLQRSYFL